MARRDFVPHLAALKNLVVDRVDFVVEGANDEAAIMLFKSHHPTGVEVSVPVAKSAGPLAEDYGTNATARHQAWATAPATDRVTVTAPAGDANAQLVALSKSLVAKTGVSLAEAVEAVANAAPELYALA